MQEHPPRISERDAVEATHHALDLPTLLYREAWPEERRAIRAGWRLVIGPPGTRSAADEVVIELEEQHAVRRALATLDERCRTLLTLLFYSAEPPSYAAIAAKLGTREGSIGPTRARCLEKLRRLADLADS